MPDDLGEIRAAYDRIAGAYLDRFGDELRHKPLDRALLRVVVDAAPPGLPVLDAGCGPGHLTRYVRELGADAMGIDVSPGMVALAGERNPDIPFRVASLLELGVPDASCAAVIALYSVIHLPQGALPDAMREFSRVLSDGGLVLLSFHVGNEVVHRDEMLGHPVSLDFHLLRMDDVTAACASAGLLVDATLERRPYAPTEAPTRRGYVLARKGSPD